MGSFIHSLFGDHRAMYRPLSLVFLVIILAGSLLSNDIRSDLSAEEIRYIDTHPVLRVGNENDWPPFDFVQSGQPAGFSIDMVRLMAAKLGIRAEFYNGYSWPELMEMLNSGQIDVLPAIYDSPERARSMSMTAPYSDQPTIMVVRQNSSITSVSDVKDRRIAVIPGFLITSSLRQQLPSAEFLEVDGVTDGLKAVSLGTADVFFESVGTVSYTLETNYIPGIRMLSEPGLGKFNAPALRMAVKRDNVILHSILEKSLKALSREEMRTIRNKWLNSGPPAVSADDDTIGHILQTSLLLFMIITAAGLAVYVSVRHLNIAPKIWAVLTSVSILAVALVIATTYFEVKKVLEQDAFTKLTALRDIKAMMVSDYFQSQRTHARSYSEDEMIIRAMAEFQQAADRISEKIRSRPELLAEFQTVPEKNHNRKLSANSAGQPAPIPGNPLATVLQAVCSSPGNPSLQNTDPADLVQPYSTVLKRFDEPIRTYLSRFDINDLYLISNEGIVVYNADKGPDIGTDLRRGQWKESGLAQAYTKAEQEAADKVILTDFEAYTPNRNIPAAFVSTAIKNQDRRLGILVFRLGIEKINNVMTSYQDWYYRGLGSSGETYIVADNKTLRNESRFFLENPGAYLKTLASTGLPDSMIEQIRHSGTCINIQKIDTKGATAALSGQSGTDIFPDYRHIPVLSSYKPLDIQGLHWAILSEIDVQEAFSHITAIRNSLAGWILGLFVCISIFSLVFARTMTRPLKQLAGHALEVTRGNLNMRIDIPMKDEIGTLARQFDSMRQSLKNSISDLEHRVHERTGELEQQKQQLESERILLNTVLENINQGLLAYDSDMKLIIANSRFQKMGQIPDDLVQAGTSFEDLISYDIRRTANGDKEMEELLANQIDLYKSQQAHKFERLQPDGHIIEVEGSVMPGGGFVSTFTDITERKIAEMNLSRLATAIHQSANGIVITDLKGVILFVNPAFTQLTGYSREEAIGNSTNLLHSGKHDKKFYDSLWQTIQSGRVWNGEIINKRRDGSFYYEDMTISPVFSNEKEIINYVAVKQDITEQKKLEKELEQAKKRMETELNIGHDIQMNMVPKKFPPFPEKREFSIFAILDPAREVGGDFYDFFLIDDNTLCTIIADVSGKGVPAALFMAVTKTLIKSLAVSGKSTSEIISSVNRQLCENNDAQMFVTSIISILDLKSGRLSFTNTGHNPPYLMTGSSVEKLDMHHGLALGILDDAPYTENTVTLARGDFLLMYTDGVTEAQNKNGAFFGSDKLESFLESRNFITSVHMTNSLLMEVKKFEGYHEQTDDIAILSLRYLGPVSKKPLRRLDLVLDNTLDSIPSILENTGTTLSSWQIAANISSSLGTVIDEILSNVITHGFEKGQKSEIQFSIELYPTRIRLIIRDDGREFNPFADTMPPDVRESIDKRRPGGLGIHIVKNLMDTVEYRREAEKNIIILDRFETNHA